MLLNMEVGYLLVQVIGIFGFQIFRLCRVIAFAFRLSGFVDLHEVSIELSSVLSLASEIECGDIGHLVRHVGLLERGALSNLFGVNRLFFKSPEEETHCCLRFSLCCCSLSISPLFRQLAEMLSQLLHLALLLLRQN